MESADDPLLMESADDPMLSLSEASTAAATAASADRSTAGRLSLPDSAPEVPVEEDAGRTAALE